MHEVQRLVLLTVLLILGNASFAQTSKRDLRRYDNGGKFKFRWGTPETHKKSSEKLREFIWTHWLAKTRGRVELVRYSLHGDPLIRHIYIEPNSKGIWQIKSEWDNYCCSMYLLMRPKKKRVHRRGIDVYTRVERVDHEYRWLIEYNVTKSTVGFPATENLSPDKYILRLKKPAPSGEDLML